MKIETKLLRTIVEQKLNVQWSDFTARHPHLAGAIDRTRLVETTVEQLRDSDEYRDALRQAAVDESAMVEALRLIDVIDRLVMRFLP